MKLTKKQKIVIDRLTHGNEHIAVSSEGKHCFVLSGHPCGFGRIHKSTVDSLVRRGILKLSPRYFLNK
jgi:hypothetical protein